MSDLGTPHVPPVNWSQVPAELWPLPVVESEQLELDFSGTDES